MPAIGTPASRPFSLPSPYTSADEQMRGNVASGTPTNSHNSGFASRVSMFISNVREALVTSVAWTPPSGPPVRFQSSHESMVPTANAPASARARAPSTWSRIQAAFGPAKYVAGGSPVRSAIISACSASASTCACVRVSCHTIALCTGSPVARSHTTVVSRWFVMPTAAMLPAFTPAFASATATTSRVLRQISAASCSTHPARGKIC